MRRSHLAAVVAHELLELLGVGVVVLVVTDGGRLVGGGQDRTTQGRRDRTWQDMAGLGGTGQDKT